MTSRRAAGQLAEGCLVASLRHLPRVLVTGILAVVVPVISPECEWCDPTTVYENHYAHGLGRSTWRR